MTILVKSSKQIVALHDGVVYFFSVEALEGRRDLPKDKDNPENLCRRVVGFYVDKETFKAHEVFGGQLLVKMMLDAPTPTVVITKKRLDSLEYDSDKLNALEAGGVDNWDFYDVSLEAFRAERE